VSLFKKKPSGFDEPNQQSAGKSSGSLIVLLVLLGGFAYLYFFTSLIIPHEASTPVKAPTAATEVKQSMPPKPADQAETPAVEMSKPGEVMTTVPPVSPPAKPASPTEPAPATAKPAVPAPVPAPAKTAVPATAKTAVPKTVKPAAAPPVGAAPNKTVVTDKKAEAKPGKAVESKPAAAVQQKEAAKSAKVTTPSAAKPVAREKTEAYSVFAGEFPAGTEAAAAEVKITRLGIKPVSRTETRSSRTMYRLFSGAYTDYDAYLAELDKLRQSTKGAFGVERNGTYFLYAGSFSARDRVEKEKKDLAAKGVNLQIQQTVLALATVKLTAGPFSSKKEADNAAAKMKGAGLAAKVVSPRR
jgi:cell division protein FtsN